ncbi:hypothetical protein BEQ56_08030 [Anaerolineaceae bacterium oral taxon 439]|nr:hypothetical protein BEQ56_08030 [Anaerolineaceae bacterium oral taxon 439]
MTRYLGVDLGEKNIGVALSDPMGMIAKPYRVLRHENRAEDARRLADIARAESASVIIVGQALGPNGEETPSARHAAKVAQAIRDVFPEGDVRLWDESGSTRAVKRLYIEMGVPRKDRRGHLDDRAAAYILQDYLDWQAPPQFSTDNRDEGNENGSDG